MCSCSFFYFFESLSLRLYIVAFHDCATLHTYAHYSLLAHTYLTRYPPPLVYIISHQHKKNAHIIYPCALRLLGSRLCCGRQTQCFRYPTRGVSAQSRSTDNVQVVESGGQHCDVDSKGWIEWCAECGDRDQRYGWLPPFLTLHSSYTTSTLFRPLKLSH